MKLTTLLFLLPMLAFSNPNEVVLRYVNVLPENTERQFLKAIDDTINKKILDKKFKFEFPIYQPQFSDTKNNITTISNDLNSKQPSSKYQISFLTTKDYNSFSIIGISRNYINYQDSILNGHTYYPNRFNFFSESTTSADVKLFPIYCVELSNYKSFLSPYTVKKLEDLVYKLLLKELVNKNSFFDSINASAVIRCSISKYGLNFPNKSYFDEFYRFHDQNQLTPYSQPDENSRALEKKQADQVFMNYDTIKTSESSIPFVQMESNELEFICFHIHTYISEQPLKYESISTIKSFYLIYDFVGLEYMAPLNEWPYLTPKNIWYKKDALIKCVNNKSFNAFLELIYYNYFFSKLD